MIERIANDVTILQGDVLEQLRKLKKESFHAVITSPPYWNLRDYGVDGQIGLEEDPRLFIKKLVKVFRAVRRVLRKDGTLWVNMGDNHIHQTVQRRSFRRDGAAVLPKGFKVKDKALMPFRLAIALQEDGWYLRQDIIWHKQQPQPETVSDRPTTAHEYFFLLSKSARYWYDAEAIAEACSEKTNLRSSAANALRSREERDAPMQPKMRMTTPNGWAVNSVDRTSVEHSRRRASGVKNNESFVQGTLGAVETRNKRSVWPVYTDRMDLKLCENCKTVFSAREFETLKQQRVNVDGFDQVRTICSHCEQDNSWLSHFAAFGPEWIEPAVLAGCPAAVCAKCGQATELDAEGRTILTCGHQPDLGAYYTPQTVAGTLLDIFAGTGTTGGVAIAHGRKATLIELNPDYVRLMPARMEQVMRKLLDAPAPPAAPGGKKQMEMFEMIKSDSPGS